jgi:hypothetical protein
VPKNKPPLPSSSSSERATNYFDVLVMVNASYRVIVTRCGLTWALQRRAPTKSSASLPTRRKRHSDTLPDDQAWFGVAYCSTSRELIRAVIANAGQIDDAAADLLHDMPDQCGGDPDPFDQLRADLTHQHNPGRPRKSPKLRPPKPPAPEVTRDCQCGTTFVLAPTAMNRRYCSTRCKDEQWSYARRADKAGKPASAPSCEPAPTQLPAETRSWTARFREALRAPTIEQGESHA